MREPIVISWEAWKASRGVKRETLRRVGLAEPSRRTKSVGSADARLRKAFAGRRIPAWAEGWKTNEFGLQSCIWPSRAGRRPPGVASAT